MIFRLSKMNTLIAPMGIFIMEIWRSINDIIIIIIIGGL